MDACAVTASNVLAKVDEELLPYFTPAAKRLLPAAGDTEELKSPSFWPPRWPRISGQTEAPPPRSLLTGAPNSCTYMVLDVNGTEPAIRAGDLLRALTEIDRKLADGCGKIRFMEGQNGMCFDVDAAYMSDLESVSDLNGFELSVCTQLPELIAEQTPCSAQRWIRRPRWSRPRPEAEAEEAALSVAGGGGGYSGRGGGYRGDRGGGFRGRDRDGGGGYRGRSEGGYERRDGGGGDRPRRDFGDRPPRRDYNDRPPRRDYGGDGYGGGGGGRDRAPARSGGLQLGRLVRIKDRLKTKASRVSYRAPDKCSLQPNHNVNHSYIV